MTTNNVTTKPNSEVENLFDTVVKGGYCVGCGACAMVSGSSIKMDLDSHGQFVARINTDETGSSSGVSVQTVCPFSNESLNEDELSKELFGKTAKHHKKIGYYLSTYAGYVNEGDFRSRGSSGGMATWVISKLLSEDLIDGVIHVHQRQPTENDSRLFQYQLSTTLEQIQNGAKSRYYPIELSQVLEIVRERPGRYAIVGIPCFIKAVRLLTRQDPILAERIKFCIGLVCGHLKSKYFADMFAWQCEIQPNSLTAFDFRRKIPGKQASDYGIEATGIDQNGQSATHTGAIRNLYGADWGLGFFKYKACDYCDDVMAETADIVVGDAWLPQYIRDSQGTNVVVVRHPLIHQLIEKAISDGQLKFDHISVNKIVKSQSSGFSHRHAGLAYRLYLADREGNWRPQKRIKPKANHFNKKHQERHKLRILLAEKSHSAFQAALALKDFSVFKQTMEPIVKKYREASVPPLWKRGAKQLKKIAQDLLRKVN
jgi:coenzyme F420 hydrogenase subunit beta